MNTLYILTNKSGQFFYDDKIILIEDLNEYTNKDNTGVINDLKIGEVATVDGYTIKALQDE